MPQDNASRHVLSSYLLDTTLEYRSCNGALVRQTCRFATLPTHRQLIARQSSGLKQREADDCFDTSQNGRYVFARSTISSVRQKPTEVEKGVDSN